MSKSPVTSAEAMMKQKQDLCVHNQNVKSSANHQEAYMYS